MTGRHFRSVHNLSASKWSILFSSFALNNTAVQAPHHTTKNHNSFVALTITSHPPSPIPPAYMRAGVLKHFLFPSYIHFATTHTIIVRFSSCRLTRTSSSDSFRLYAPEMSASMFYPAVSCTLQRYSSQFMFMIPRMLFPQKWNLM